MSGVKRKSGVSDQEIIDCYLNLQSAYAVCRQLKVNEKTVYRVLAIAGIERTGIKKYREDATRFKPEIAKQIRRKYEAGTLVKDLLEEFGGSYYSIKKAIHDSGGKLRPNPAPELKDGELEKIKELYESGISQFYIGIRLKRSQAFISRTLRNNGILPHPGGGNGRYKTGNGYWRVFVSLDDPMASMRNNTGYALEHRLVMARKLGRPLLPTETVHHIDGDVSNNSPDNLQLRQGKHGKHVVFRCSDCGSHNIVSDKIADTEITPAPAFA